MGAQKVKKDFSEIEREAEIADQMKYRLEEDRKLEEEKRMEDESKAAANMRLAYQDISLQQKKKVRRLIKGLAATLLYLELYGPETYVARKSINLCIYFRRKGYAM